MNDLTSHLKAEIERCGSITVEAFVRLALTGRPDSYYVRRDPLGASGDFVTAPEISQVFGECIGIWCVDLWTKLGSPKRFKLIELGPGRGTLMSDILRSARIRPEFLNGATVALVEVNPVLKLQQEQVLASAGLARVEWSERFEDIQLDSPAIVVANEFLDALPARQFIKHASGWSERVVTIGQMGELTFAASSGPDCTASIPVSVRAAGDGAIFECSQEGLNVAGSVARALATHGGGLLAVDYGHWGPALGDTLQAIRSHAYADVLDDPGNSDLTFHVDFGALSGALERAGLSVHPMITQGDFLTRLGAIERTQQLKRGASPSQCKQLDNALNRLTSDQAMGTLFKVLTAVSSPSILPAGFHVR